MKIKWVDLKNYEDSHEISSNGAIRTKIRKIYNKDGSLNRISKKRKLVLKENKQGYVFCQVTKESKTKRLAVHRLVYSSFNPLEDISKKQIDHIDLIKNNNNIFNLRPCDNSQNQANRGIRTHKKSKLPKGVYKSRLRYVASITKNQKKYYLGHFKDVNMAAKAYDEKALELFGEFAYLNEIRSDE